MVSLCPSVSFSRPECLISSCFIAAKNVSCDTVTFALNCAQMLLASRVALRLAII